MANPPSAPNSKPPDTGTGTSQFDTAKGPGGLTALEEKILGPSYNYSGHIKSPSEMGMSANGTFDALGDDIKGILGYIDLLVGGKCTLGSCASKNLTNPDGSGGGTYKGPLGNKFFLETPVKCKDVVTGKDVTRSIYINNVPDGSIPLVTDLTGATFPDFVGIMPGIMSNVAQIRPMQILMAFVSGTSSACQTVIMPTINTKKQRGTGQGFITNSDIGMMPASWFSSANPKSSYNLKDPEKFSTMSGESDEEEEEKENKIDYSKMPDDIMIKLYYSALGLIGLYILLRLMLRKK